MGLFNDFFGSKKSIAGGETISKYSKYDRYGQIAMEKQLKNVNYRDRQKLREMFKKHGGLEHGRKMSNEQITKMMKTELGNYGADFKKRIKSKVLTKKETMPVGLTEEQKHGRALGFRYDRAAEEEAKNRKGPGFANAFNYKSGFDKKEANSRAVSANPVEIRGNNPADRVTHELKNNPHLGL